ncbi:dCTP deaminase [archaeon]|nr:dCTP deaminase [archaeon]
MILSDRDIKQYLQEGKIKINPLDIENQLAPVSIDLRLGDEFRVFKVGHNSHIDPSKHSLEDSTELVKVDSDKPFIIHPGDFVLGVTKENVELPDNIAARMEGRSSLGRLGIIVHSTAGKIDPGWKGKLTLEITNIGKLPVALYPEMKFCSLVFEPTSSPVEKPYSKVGKYAGMETPVTSKISEEFQKK